MLFFHSTQHYIEISPCILPLKLCFSPTVSTPSTTWREALPASSGWWPEMLCTILQCIKQSPKQSITGKLWSKIMNCQPNCKLQVAEVYILTRDVKYTRGNVYVIQLCVKLCYLIYVLNYVLLPCAIFISSELGILSA